LLDFQSHTKYQQRRIKDISEFLQAKNGIVQEFPARLVDVVDCEPVFGKAKMALAP
jgi:hypothetical protein